MTESLEQLFWVPAGDKLVGLDVQEQRGVKIGGLALKEFLCKNK